MHGHRSQAGSWGWHCKCKLNVYSVTAPSTENKAELLSVLEPLKSKCSQVTELPNQFCENYAFLLHLVLVLVSVETSFWTLCSMSHK